MSQHINVGLEAWLLGTFDELRAAYSVLASQGRVAYASKPHHLAGKDIGRARMFLRVTSLVSGQEATRGHKETTSKRQETTSRQLLAQQGGLL